MSIVLSVLVIIIVVAIVVVLVVIVVNLQLDNDLSFCVLLLSQVSQLKRENENLKKNISCLYNTAKIELARKDTEISELRRKQFSQR